MNFIASYLIPLRYADLIGQFARRDVQARYRSSWLGLAWLMLAPMLMLVIYTLVFRHVFQVRWADPQEGNLAFALRLYSGLAVFNFFAECVNRAPHLVLEQPHLVKKVVFPLEVLPWSSVLAAGIQLVVGGLLLVVLRWLGLGSVPWTALLLPLVWLPLVPLCLGLSWALGALGTYVRDVAQLVSMVMAALFFISPVFFPVDALPSRVQQWIWLNPLAPIMTQTRTVLLQGNPPNWSAWAFNLVGCIGIAVLGALIFRRLRQGFADVI